MISKPSIATFRLLFVVALSIALAGCFSSRGIREITVEPYPLIYQDDSTERFGDKNDTVFISVRKAALSRPLDNLAIHYQAFFPDGPGIRPGDTEEYLKIDGKNAYKVVFKPKYIRQRKRLQAGQEEKVPEGWTVRTIEDPSSGRRRKLLYGPVVRSFRMMYLIEGKSSIYNVFLRADGDSIERAKKVFEQFVREGIDYL